MKVTIQNLHIHIDPAAPVNSMGEALAKALLEDADSVPCPMEKMQMSSEAVSVVQTTNQVTRTKGN